MALYRSYSKLQVPSSNDRLQLPRDASHSSISRTPSFTGSFPLGRSSSRSLLPSASRTNISTYTPPAASPHYTDRYPYVKYTYGQQSDVSASSWTPTRPTPIQASRSYSGYTAYSAAQHYNTAAYSPPRYSPPSPRASTYESSRRPSPYNAAYLSSRDTDYRTATSTSYSTPSYKFRGQPEQEQTTRPSVPVPYTLRRRAEYGQSMGVDNAVEMYKKNFMTSNALSKYWLSSSYWGSKRDRDLGSAASPSASRLPVSGRVTATASPGLFASALTGPPIRVRSKYAK